VASRPRRAADNVGRRCGSRVAHRRVQLSRQLQLIAPVLACSLDPPSHPLPRSNHLLSHLSHSSRVRRVMYPSMIISFPPVILFVACHQHSVPHASSMGLRRCPNNNQLKRPLYDDTLCLIVPGPPQRRLSVPTPTPTSFINPHPHLHLPFSEGRFLVVGRR
jgi:hypothetical protein